MEEQWLGFYTLEMSSEIGYMAGESLKEKVCAKVAESRITHVQLEVQTNNILNVELKLASGRKDQVYIIGGSVALFNGISIICLLEILGEIVNMLLPKGLKFLSAEPRCHYEEVSVYLNCTTVHGLPYLKHLK